MNPHAAPPTAVALLAPTQELLAVGYAAARQAAAAAPVLTVGSTFAPAPRKPLPPLAPPASERVALFKADHLAKPQTEAARAYLQVGASMERTVDRVWSGTPGLESAVEGPPTSNEGGRPHLASVQQGGPGASARSTLSSTPLASTQERFGVPQPSKHQPALLPAAQGASISGTMAKGLTPGSAPGAILPGHMRHNPYAAIPAAITDMELDKVRREPKGLREPSGSQCLLPPCARCPSAHWPAPPVHDHRARLSAHHAHKSHAGPAHEQVH